MRAAVRGWIRRTKELPRERRPGYDAAGLSCGPIDFSGEHYGTYAIDGCTYAVTVKNGKFVVSNGGKPIKTKLVGDPALLASNTYDANASSASSTRTTAAK